MSSYRPDDRLVKFPAGVVPPRVLTVEGATSADWYSLGPVMYSAAIVWPQTLALLQKRTVKREQVPEIEDLWPKPRVRLVYVTDVKDSGATYCVYRYRNALRYVPKIYQPPKFLYGNAQSLTDAPILSPSADEAEVVFDRLARVPRIPLAVRVHALVDHPSASSARMYVMPTALPAAAVERSQVDVQTAEAEAEFESTRVSPEFRRWFEGASSSVRNDDGSPKVFYRGQTHDSSDLKSQRVMDSFTDSADIASMYAADPGTLTFKGSVLPVYIDVKNPLTLVGAHMSLYEFLGVLGYWGDTPRFAKYTSTGAVTDEEAGALLTYLVKREKSTKLSRFNYVARGSGREAYDDDDDDDEESDFYPIEEGLFGPSPLKQLAVAWLDGDDQESIAKTLVVDTFALVEIPVVKRVLKRMGYDGVRHMDTFTAENAPKKLLNKELEDVDGIEYGEDRYDLPRDMREMAYSYGHWTLRPLDRSQVWPLLSSKPYEEGVRFAAKALLSARVAVLLASGDIVKDVVAELATYPERGYCVRQESWRMPGPDGGPPVDIVAAYSIPGGDYIGSDEDAEHLWTEYGITAFEKTDPQHCVCSIGRSPASGLWYGWSHRAVRGCKTKQGAIDFAKSVS